MKNRKLKALNILFCLILVSAASEAEGKPTPNKVPNNAKIVVSNSDPILIDAVIASVDGKPITLSEIGQRLNHPRVLDLKSAASDPEAHQVLDGIILERLVLMEAEARHIGVSDGEVLSYVEEIAKRNHLTAESFESALKEHGKSLNDYKEQVKFEILKSKLISSLTQGGVGVSEDEIESYLNEHPTLGKSGSKVKLSQIVIHTHPRSEEEALAIAMHFSKALSEATDFERESRDALESTPGVEIADLGIVAEEELSRQIFDAIFPLKDGQLSEPVKGPDGFHLFHLEQRFIDKEAGKQALHAEVRKILQQQKMEGKMLSYFTSELYKLHAVDKRL